MQQAQYIHIDEFGNKYHYKDIAMTIRHRLDGPAIEWKNGSRAWWVDGKFLTEEQFNNLAAPTIKLTLDDIAAKFGFDVSKLEIVK